MVPSTPSTNAKSSSARKRGSPHPAWCIAFPVPQSWQTPQAGGALAPGGADSEGPMPGSRARPVPPDEEGERSDTGARELPDPLAYGGPDERNRRDHGEHGDRGEHRGSPGTP